MEVDPLELQRMLQEKTPVLLLDVRQPWEHELVRIAGDTLIPLNELPVRAGEVKPAPGQKVVCYCHHGMRSLHAVMMLRSAGIEALSLRGGIDAWARNVDPKLATY